MGHASGGLPRSRRWRALADGESAVLTAELLRELPTDHALAGRDVAAIARHGSRDDVLVLVDRMELHVVHLTYQQETSPQWPSTSKLASLARDHEDDD